MRMENPFFNLHRAVIQQHRPLLPESHPQTLGGRKQCRHVILRQKIGHGINHHGFHGTVILRHSAEQSLILFLKILSPRKQVLPIGASHQPRIGAYPHSAFILDGNGIAQIGRQKSTAAFSRLPHPLAPVPVPSGLRMAPVSITVLSGSTTDAAALIGDMQVFFGSKGQRLNLILQQSFRPGNAFPRLPHGIIQGQAAGRCQRHQSAHRTNADRKDTLPQQAGKLVIRFP